MVSLSLLVFCLAALVSVCSAYGHNHMRHRGLAVRQITNTTYLSSASRTGGSATLGINSTSTSTLTVTSINRVTVTYTLGDGRVKTTIITKAGEPAQTIAHLKSTLTVAPVVETTPVAPIVKTTPVAPISAAQGSPDKSKSTSTATLMVTVPGGASTSTIEDSCECPATTSVCTAQTVYVPQYVTMYSTITVTAAPTPGASHMPHYSNSTMRAFSHEGTSTSTTTVSVYTTLFVKPSAYN